MSGIEWGLPTVTEQWDEAVRRLKSQQDNCKHQWIMNEVTIEGKPISVRCMHCNQIHKVEVN